MLLLFLGSTRHSSTFTGSETAANPNPNNASSITLTAQWKSTNPCLDSNNGCYDYTGSVQTFTAKQAGYYKLEVWGAQGGNADSSFRGGYGGYSYGNISLSKNEKLYVTVGQKGGNANTNGPFNGGWNGGGGEDTGNSGGINSCGYVGGGGGGSDINTSQPTLSLSNYRYISNNLSSRIIVAGGGAGAAYWERPSSYCGGNDRGDGGDGGGYEGAPAPRYSDCNNGQPQGGTQSSGGKGSAGATSTQYHGGFGYGGNGGSCAWGGGGGGWYGGGGGSGNTGPGGGGSGYINSSRLLANKGMYMYNNSKNGCKSSTATGTKTTCTTNVSSTATANYAKSGNGYARITYLGTSI